MGPLQYGKHFLVPLKEQETVEGKGSEIADLILRGRDGLRKAWRTIYLLSLGAVEKGSRRKEHLRVSPKEDGIRTRFFHRKLKRPERD